MTHIISEWAHHSCSASWLSTSRNSWPSAGRAGNKTQTTSYRRAVIEWSSATAWLSRRGWTRTPPYVAVYAAVISDNSLPTGWWWLSNAWYKQKLQFIAKFKHLFHIFLKKGQTFWSSGFSCSGYIYVTTLTMSGNTHYTYFSLSATLNRMKSLPTICKQRCITNLCYPFATSFLIRNTIL